MYIKPSKFENMSKMRSRQKKKKTKHLKKNKNRTTRNYIQCFGMKNSSAKSFYIQLREN